MSDETRATFGYVCPLSATCTWFVAGMPLPQMADLELDWHREWHGDQDRSNGLLCDPPAIPAPRVRDLTVVGLTRSVLRVLWGWAK